MPNTTSVASKRDILTLCKEQGVAFLRLQFTDVEKRRRENTFTEAGGRITVRVVGVAADDRAA